MEYLTNGYHIILDIWGVDIELIDDIAFLKKHLQEAAASSGARILSITGEKFQPHGATVLVMLSESHLSIHTYPEKGYAAIDCYTCGNHINPQDSIDYLLHCFKPKKVYSKKIIRGLGNLEVIQPNM